MLTRGQTKMVGQVVQTKFLNDAQSPQVATFGSQIVGYGGALTGATSVPATSATYEATIAVNGTSNIISLNLGTMPNQHASQTVNYGGLLTGATAVSLATATYEATVTIDSTPHVVDLDLSTTVTINAVIVAVNLQLTGATLSLSGGNLIVTDTTTGQIGSILITDATGGNTALFGSLPNYVAINSAFTPTLTVTQVLTAINTQLTGAVAALSSGNIKVTSNQIGQTSSISITDGTHSHTVLFGTLPSYVSIQTAVNGTPNDVDVFGIMHQPDGTLYVANLPTTQLTYNRGKLLCRADGVLIVIASGTPVYFDGPLGLTAAGELCVSTGSVVTSRDAFGFDSTGNLVVSATS